MRDPRDENWSISICTERVPSARQSQEKDTKKVLQDVSMSPTLIKSNGGEEESTKSMYRVTTVGHRPFLWPGVTIRKIFRCAESWKCSQWVMYMVITPLSSTWLPNYSQYCHDTFLSSPLSRDPSFAQKTNECGERHAAVVFRQISRTGAVNTRTPQDLFWTWSSVDCWRRGIRRTRVEWKEGKSAQCVLH